MTGILQPIKIKRLDAYNFYYMNSLFVFNFSTRMRHIQLVILWMLSLFQWIWRVFTTVIFEVSK